jgi:putative hemolysin
MELLYVSLIVLCIISEGFFSGSEIAVVSLSKLELQKRLKEGDKAAKLLSKLLEKPEKLLTTTLIGTNLSTVTGSTIFTAYILKDIQHALPYLGNYPELLTVLCFTPFTLTFGELIPKSLFQKYSSKLAFKIVYPIYFFYVIFKPISLLVMNFSRLIAHLFRAETERNPFVTKEELKFLVESKSRFRVEETERDILKNILHLKEKTLGDIYVPLSQVIAVSSNATVSEALELFEKSGFSKLPIFEGRIDNIVGYLLVSDLVAVEDPNLKVREVMRPVVVFPEYMSIFDALKEFRRANEQLGIVVDEFGSTLGIVTIEDILEEIVGKIEDEFDKGKIEITKSGNTLSTDASVEVSELNKLLNFPLPESTDYSSIGGLILSRLGRFPKEGEIIELPHHTIKVEKLSNKRIERVRIREKS